MDYFLIAVMSGVIGIFIPLLIIKIQEQKKRWSDDEADVVDNWKFPSNY